MADYITEPCREVLGQGPDVLPAAIRQLAHHQEAYDHGQEAQGR